MPNYVILTRRVSSQHERLHPNDPNFYLMELEHGFYIDARVKGNLSRFINHSCDPNCQLQRTNVAGDMRIGERLRTLFLRGLGAHRQCFRT